MIDNTIYYYLLKLINMDYTSFEDVKNLLSQQTGFTQARAAAPQAPMSLQGGGLGLKKISSQGGPLIQRSIIGSTLKFKKQMPRKTTAVPLKDYKS